MPSFIDNQGIERFLGNNEPKAGLVRGWPVYGDTKEAPMFRRQDWYPVSLSRYRSRIKSQSSTSACNAFAITYSLEACRKMLGLEDVLLSPGHLYGRINGGTDQGSTLQDGMYESMARGIAPASVIGILDWIMRNWPRDAADKALPFRILEAFLCPTFEHLVSSILAGFFPIIGIRWFNNFNPNQNGWLPKSGQGYVGGHALARDEVVFDGSKVGLGGPNSWDFNWGVNGTCVIPEEIFQAERDIGGWWAVRAVVQEDENLPPLKI